MPYDMPDREKTRTLIRICPGCEGHGYRLDGSACETCFASGRIRIAWVGDVQPYESPMTPQTLSDAVDDVVRLAQARVGPDSIGAKQYHVDGQPQKFESMPLLGLIDYSIEEALDHINYGVMLTIRLQRLRAMVEEAERRATEGT